MRSALTGVDENWVEVGQIAAPYGVRGWFKVNSFTEPRNNILDYGPWHLVQDGAVKLTAAAKGKLQGKSLIAQIDGVNDRDAADDLRGTSILVDRENFAPTHSGEYYWRDLVGLQVSTEEGLNLGTVDSLMETGANDVLIVQGDRRRLIPFVNDDVIISVDLAAGNIVVAWDPEF